MMGQKVKVLSEDGLREERTGYVVGRAQMLDGQLLWCVCEGLQRDGAGGVWLPMGRVLRVNEAPDVSNLNAAGIPG
jgi:hypothetical protein